MSNGNKIMKNKNWTRKILTALLFSLLAISVAIAGGLSQPKADGLIGEQANGYLGLVNQNAPADVKSLISSINAKRKAGYKRIAQQQGTPLSDVEKVGGKTAIEKTLRGNYIREAGSGWRKK